MSKFERFLLFMKKKDFFYWHFQEFLKAKT